MQWSWDLASEMHQRRLVRDKARRSDTLPSSYHPCDCTADWRCEPHDACFIHDSCFCLGSGSFPQLSPHVLRYRPITPNPCALGQQVTAILSRLIVSSRLVYSYPGS